MRGRIQVCDVEGYAAADDSAEATADWVARIPARADCGETRFPPVGMELGVSGYDTRVAAGQGSTYARTPAAPGRWEEEEASFGALFKHSKSSKNGYKTRDYKDRFRRNVAVALIQLLQPHRTTYITSWQVGFVELALSGAPIHWARILWKATRQHAFEEKVGSINHLSPFLINSYRSMGCLTASKRIQFPLLSCSNPRRYVKDVEVDSDEDETPACTPPAQPRAEEEPLAARVPRKRKWEGEAEQSQQRDAAAPNRKRPMTELCSRPKQKARRLVLPRVQFPLLSRSNPGRYVKDVEVDTDEDETPACTPPAQPRAEEEPLVARVPRKRKWKGEAEQS
ncbi:hypothetical protein AXG93_3364s1000 [Marchantia polymorpha subsp. ruderalis]|uniref:Uncharacterized protein n=1 Tax=Marchantia polymorpha subsp. ruderalis TaxID=1480154 RepID=A0A176WR55_MARPO|nr:hypothetical protein AXG93_3364s1000 [Marchantia polymorpha subsp. ruderalis]